MEKIIFVCDKCGEVMPTKESESNQNWTVYETECPCGGRGIPKVIKD